MSDCTCTKDHQSRRIVLTGGPGAGKTAVLELIRRAMCHHVHVLPESAGIVFKGGFPREARAAVQRPAQRAIYYVQRELEATTLADDHAIVVCDRGTLDGLAYWPGPEDMLASLGTSLGNELERYDAVLHLRTPAASDGYRTDPLRIETADEAVAIDARIAEVWAKHPRRFEVPATTDFFAKVVRAFTIIQNELPECCRKAALG